MNDAFFAPPTHGAATAAGVATAAPDFLTSVFRLDLVDARHLAEALVRFLCAFALGAVIAYRPWRKLLGGRAPAPLPAETSQAQTIIAVAGAVVIAVIGDVPARAFGLVGLGAFIRFRSGIKDPRDAAVMFVMIGIGMACGLGLVGTALIGTAFVSVVLAAFDRFGRARRRRLRVGVLVEDPPGAYPAVRAAFPGARALELPRAAGAGPGKIAFETDAPEEADAATVLASLEKAGVPGLRAVTLEED